MSAEHRNHCGLQGKEIHEKLMGEKTINVRWVQPFVNDHMERNKINNPVTSPVKAKRSSAFSTLVSAFTACQIIQYFATLLTLPA